MQCTAAVPLHKRHSLAQIVIPACNVAEAWCASVILTYHVLTSLLVPDSMSHRTLTPDVAEERKRQQDRLATMVGVVMSEIRERFIWGMCSCNEVATL